MGAWFSGIYFVSEFVPTWIPGEIYPLRSFYWNFFWRSLPAFVRLDGWNGTVLGMGSVGRWGWRNPDVSTVAMGKPKGWVGSWKGICSYKWGTVCNLQLEFIYFVDYRRLAMIWSPQTNTGCDSTNKTEKLNASVLVAATLTRRHSQLGTRRLVGPSDIAGVAACVNVRMSQFAGTS